ncbi:MAG: hypothetical protein NTZ09_13975, partial [Candidatus Hydrogenedentes bacterium]|nr:hypothetical protein [Candidatus Hydrogenedentota bacterium]
GSHHRGDGIARRASASFVERDYTIFPVFAALLVVGCGFGFGGDGDERRIACGPFVVFNFVGSDRGAVDGFFPVEEDPALENSRERSPRTLQHGDSIDC